MSESMLINKVLKLDFWLADRRNQPIIRQGWKSLLYKEDLNMDFAL